MTTSATTSSASPANIQEFAAQQQAEREAAARQGFEGLYQSFLPLLAATEIRYLVESAAGSQQRIVFFRWQGGLCYFIRFGLTSDGTLTLHGQPVGTDLFPQLLAEQAHNWERWAQKRVWEQKNSLLLDTRRATFWLMLVVGGFCVQAMSHFAVLLVPLLALLGFLGTNWLIVRRRKQGYPTGELVEPQYSLNPQLPQQ